MFLGGSHVQQRRGGKYAKIEQYKRVKTAEIRRDLGQLEALRKQRALIVAAALRASLNLSAVANVGAEKVGAGAGGPTATYIMDNGIGTTAIGGTHIQNATATANEEGGSSSNTVDMHFMVYRPPPVTVAHVIEEGMATSPVKRDIVGEFMAFIKLRGVAIICNVYQETYKGGRKATGFGDFIRGCYFLVQFCTYLKHQKGVNIEADYMITHPVGALLEYRTVGGQWCPQGVVAFDKQNWIRTIFHPTGKNTDVLNSAQHLTDFMEYFMTSAVIYGRCAYVYTIAYPLWGAVAEHSRNILQKMLHMGVKMEEYVGKLLGVFGLVAGGYKVVHIRSGDRYLSGGGGGFRDDYKAKLINGIRGVVGNVGVPVLLIADNNYIKDVVIAQFPFMRAMKKEIGHLGEGQTQTMEKMRNTMADFYLMGKSCAIYSFTSYAHGSGFSKWCAETYGIPYLCFFI